jgi:serine/threonine-protein kinase RsbW
MDRPVMTVEPRDPGPPSTLSLSISARPENLVFCRLALAGLARTRWIDPEVVADLKLAVTEACSNSIRHAYDGLGGTVSVRFRLDEHRIEIEVEDQGCGFVPRSGGAGGAELPESGMGLALIGALTDELAISAGPGGQGSLLRFSRGI